MAAESSSSPHRHENGGVPKTPARRLALVLILTAGYFATEVVAALLTGSLALLADAGHMLTDVGALALALLAISFRQKPSTPRRTYGFYRMEILAALTNGIVLASLAVFIMFEAYGRILDPPEVQALPVAVVAAIGLGVNLAGLKIIGHSHHGNLNVEGARLEVFSDALGSAGVAVAGITIALTGLQIVDPIVSIGLALFILPRIWSLANRSIHILMEGVPPDIPYEQVRDAMLAVKGVTGLFDLHIWTITSGMDALSAHVVVLNPGMAQEILREMTAMLEKRFGITHATIQIETYHPPAGSPHR
ncbi:cation diffusion facilitator family transporter [Nitrososphaera sp.]|uniref:cation diffusion facilitator family transporter n=1 Tax=Nitrososphaera sp. TaxID=1971748 RepID=UPI00307D486E